MSCAAPRGLRCRNPYEQEDRMSETGTRTRITEVGTVFVPVSDQDRAIDFYVGQLGFEKRGDFVYGGGHRWVEVGPSGSAIGLALVSGAEGVATATSAARCAFATADIDGLGTRLRENGV